MLKQTAKYLLENGLESFLIVAAVALGIGVIVSFTSFIELGNSLEQASSQELSFRETVLSKISDRLHVLPYSDRRKIYEITNMVAQEVDFTLLDLEQIKREIPDIDFAYVRQEITTSVLKDGDDKGFFTVFYVTEDFWPASGIQLVSGNPIPKSDFAEGRPTALLSERVARYLDIQVGGQNPERFQLPGPVDSPGYTAIGIFQGMDESLVDPDIIVPLDPASSISEVRLVVENQTGMAQVLTSLEAYAQRTWGEGVAIRAPFNWQEFQGGQRGLMRTIIFFASLGLLIAALNIVNLMTARILKRYKDIGIWRTLGATTRQVVQQVFAEVFILVLMGGALGVVLSLGLIALYNDYLRTTLQLDENFFALPPLALAVALLCTISVGTLVALYPALLASRVRIVDALREL
ncbi:MAG: ABC transporter permease [Truepera sp.]|nr:ABC transporter permease [Truepera sp.]